jgi:hypothetical protein
MQNSQKGTSTMGNNNSKHEVTPQTIWTTAKSFMNRDGLRAPTAMHGRWGLKFNLLEKANEIADCLEMQLTSHNQCDENHECQVETGVQALLKAVDDSPERLRPCGLRN